jgi:hypothetical protein
MSSPKPNLSQSGLARGLFYACLAGMLLLAVWWSTQVIGTATSAKATPTRTAPTPATNADRLAKPPLSASQASTQLGQGTLLYWGVCMACHGDRGQGLTNEWRAVYGEDQNCWASSATLPIIRRKALPSQKVRCLRQ